MINDANFGNYRLIRRLGSGGMAEVLLATQQGPSGFARLVAIKRILSHLSENPQFIDLFMEEARLSAQLSHPNIAHIYDFGILDDSYYITMEYIDGIDLRVVLRPDKAEPLPFEHAARIIADVCSGLHYAHQLTDNQGCPLQLVHRDISPHNILVGFNGSVKVVDFGLAKAAHHLDRTRPGLVRGKFTYMSPEQVTGRPLDGRSDVFCAGIVLYELCTDGTLLPREDAMEAMRIIRGANFPRPLRRGEPIPPLLEEVITRSLAKRREDRYATAAEMQMALETYLRSTDTISNTVVLSEYFQRHYRLFRHPPDPERTTVKALDGHSLLAGGETATAHPLLGSPTRETDNQRGQDQAPPPATSRGGAQLEDPARDGAPVPGPGPTLNTLRGEEWVGACPAGTSPAERSASSASGLQNPLLASLMGAASNPQELRAGQVVTSDAAELFPMDSEPTTPRGPSTPATSHQESSHPARPSLRFPAPTDGAEDSRKDSRTGDSYLVSLLAGVERQGTADSAEQSTDQDRPVLLPAAPHGLSRRAWMAIGVGVAVVLIAAAVIGYKVATLPRGTGPQASTAAMSAPRSDAGKPPSAPAPDVHKPPASAAATPAGPTTTAPKTNSTTSGKTPPSATTLTVLTEPRGATVTLDGELLSGNPPLKRTLVPGEHRLVATHPGYKPRSQAVTLQAGASTSVTLTLAPDTRPVPTAPPSNVNQAAAPHRRTRRPRKRTHRKRHSRPAPIRVEELPLP